MRTDDIEQMMNRWRWFSYGLRLAEAPCATNVPGRMFRRNPRAQSPFLFAQSHDPPPGRPPGSPKPPPPPLPRNPSAKPVIPSPSDPSQTRAVDPTEVAPKKGSIGFGYMAIASMLLIPLALLGVAFYVFGFRESVDSREPTERVRQDLLEDPFSDPDDPFGPSNSDDPFGSSVKTGEGLSPEIDRNNIPLEDFKIDVSFTHPTLGDITEQKWLIDGTEIAIDVHPQALGEDRDKTVDRIEKQTVSFTLNLDDNEKGAMEKEVDLADGVTLTYGVDGADIRQLIASQAQSGSSIHRLIVHAKIGSKDVEVRREVEVPHISVTLRSQHLLAILEPTWFFGQLGKSKRLYEFEDRGNWLDKLQQFQPDKAWYAHDDTNRLASSMLLFGSNPLREAATLREFLALDYPGELDRSFEDFKKHAKGPIAEMLNSIQRQMKDNEEGFPEGLVALDLMNKLLLKQAEVMQSIRNQLVNASLAEVLWQEPREIVRQLEKTLQEPGTWSRLYAPPFSREKEITSFISNWISRPVVQESWKQIIDKTEGLEKMIDRPILKTSLLTLESEDDELVIPVVVAYQPGKGTSLLQAPVRSDPGKGGLVDDPFGGR
jgi:hypothetical protein